MVIKLNKSAKAESERELAVSAYPIVVCVCFFSLSLPTKLHCYDVMVCAVEIWGQQRGRGRVSGCPTCE